MEKKARFNWEDAVELIVVLRNGRRINLGEKEIKKIVSALILAAIHGFGSAWTERGKRNRQRHG